MPDIHPDSGSGYEHMAGAEQDVSRHVNEPSSLDYFIAGAKDFGNDIRDVISGNSKGPNFENRRKLMQGK